MGWVRLSDDFYDNDKLGEVGPIGVAIWVACIAYCNRNRTDGFLPKYRARGLIDCSGIAVAVKAGDLIQAHNTDCTDEVLAHLVEAGALHVAGHGCQSCIEQQTSAGHKPDPGPKGYLVHDYLGFQKSNDQIEADLAAGAKRIAAWRKRQKNDQSNAVSNGVSTNDPNPNPNPNPNPSTSSGYVSKELTSVGEKKAPAKAVAKRGTRIADDFMPLQATIDTIKAEFPGIENSGFVREHRVFCDFWQAKPGQGGVKLDWEATWRNWMRKHFTEHPPGQGGTGKVDAKVAGWAQLGGSDD